MIEALKHIFPNFILVASMVYIWHILLNKKINFKSIRLYISVFGLMIFSIYGYLMLDKFIRVLLLTIVFIVFFKVLCNEKIRQCSIVPIFYQMTHLSELIILHLFAHILFNFIILSSYHSCSQNPDRS